jgi:hypothetical protein
VLPVYPFVAEVQCNTDRSTIHFVPELESTQRIPNETIEMDKKDIHIGPLILTNLLYTHNNDRYHLMDEWELVVDMAVLLRVEQLEAFVIQPNLIQRDEFL